jgi:MFS family permease
VPLDFQISGSRRSNAATTISVPSNWELHDSAGLALVTWVIISEIFPNRIRGAAMSIAVVSLWIACFILTYTFPILNKALGAAGTFWICAGVCICGFVFIKLRLPETKGKTLEEIEKQLVD